MNTTRNGSTIAGSLQLVYGAQSSRGKLSATDIRDLEAVQQQLRESSVIQLLAQTNDLRVKQTSLKQ